MSRIYINGTNIPNVYVNGLICPAYFNGMLITDGSEPPVPPHKIKIGNKYYNTIIIGNQEWIVEDLDYNFDGLNFRDNQGEPPRHITNDGTIPQGAYYDYNTSNKKYGILYNGACIYYIDSNYDTLGIPYSWRIPSKQDFQNLIDFIGDGPEGGRITPSEAIRAEEWDGADTYGFKALPAGQWNRNNNFTGKNEYLNLWSTTEARIRPPGTSEWETVGFDVLGITRSYYRLDISGYHSFETCASIRLVRDYYTATDDPEFENIDCYVNGTYTDFFNTLLDPRRSPEKVILLLRHGARNSDQYGKEDPLNNRGITYSTNLGSSLSQLSPLMRNSCSFFGTDYFRTRQTAAYIASGLGFTNNPESWVSNVSDFTAIHGNWYTSITNWERLSDFCYDERNRDDIVDKSMTLIQRVIDKANQANENYSIMISHDQLLAPLLAFAFNFSQDSAKKITANNWVHFLSGVGIITYDDKTFEIVPIMGNDDTFI